jgi:tRNA(fMet)-specific endonuclease VapC
MSLYVLDTDILSLHERDHPALSPRIRAHPPGDVVITVLSVEEQLSGWYTMLRRATRPEDLGRVYERLAKTVQFTATLPILSFSVPAINRYEALLAMKLNVRKNDLRIAAIALEKGATIVTRNLRDFQRVPGLNVEDWSV